jgi:glycosyltransferase involved in cell wall biosynthesis
VKGELDLACVVSVYNEETVLQPAIGLLVSELRRCSDNFRVIIASNGSTDGTERLGRELEGEFPGEVRLLVCRRKGRGWALREAIGGIKARRYLYVDVDLPLELSDLGRLLVQLDQGADLVVSKRRGDRPWLRRAMTLSLRGLNRLWFSLKVSDSQCAVKALSPAAARVLTGDCRENGWYLDTELVVFCAWRGLKIAEVPIQWIETRFPNRPSKVVVGSDTLDFLWELGVIWRRRARLPRNDAGAVHPEPTIHQK